MSGGQGLGIRDVKSYRVVDRWIANLLAPLLLSPPHLPPSPSLLHLSPLPPHLPTQSRLVDFDCKRNENDIVFA